MAVRTCLWCGEPIQLNFDNRFVAHLTVESNPKECKGSYEQQLMKAEIIVTSGDMFSVNADGIVNPCNALGIAGAGLSKLFREMYPDNFELYVEACKNRVLKHSIVFMTHNPERRHPFVFNFPSKPNPRIPANLGNISSTMPSFIQKLKEAQIMGLSSVVVPALGCGLGGLSWDKVLLILQYYLERVEWTFPITIYLFGPQ